jgi:hypothetical protein
MRLLVLCLMLVTPAFGQTSTKLWVRSGHVAGSNVWQMGYRASTSKGVLRSVVLDCGDGEVFNIPTDVSSAKTGFRITGLHYVLSSQYCTPQKPGTYTANLIAIDSNGKSSASSVSYVLK